MSSVKNASKKLSTSSKKFTSPPSCQNVKDLTGTEKGLEIRPTSLTGDIWKSKLQKMKKDNKLNHFLLSCVWSPIKLFHQCQRCHCKLYPDKPNIHGTIRYPLSTLCLLVVRKAKEAKLLCTQTQQQTDGTEENHWTIGLTWKKHFNKCNSLRVKYPFKLWWKNLGANSGLWCREIWK